MARLHRVLISSNASSRRDLASRRAWRDSLRRVFREGVKRELDCFDMPAHYQWR
jgi:hypothetical protein